MQHIASCIRTGSSLPAEREVRVGECIHLAGPDFDLLRSLVFKHPLSSNHGQKHRHTAWQTNSFCVRHALPSNYRVSVVHSQTLSENLVQHTYIYAWLCFVYVRSYKRVKRVCACLCARHLFLNGWPSLYDSFSYGSRKH